MEVVGSDEQRIGTVDKVQGDRIILTKNDPESGGMHRSFGCNMIDRIEGDKLVLSQPAEQAKRELHQEPGFDERSGKEQRGGMEQRPSDQQRGEGPHNLERSFSGTYR
ncbi:MAG: DUF2171 domain-containing protein, partial [Sphingomonadales bacterium]|nr:DUF2171 domain-containing protein [Sphingomonadales bacterium]